MGSKATVFPDSADRRANWTFAQLHEELLAHGPSAILPQNLSDAWLKRLAVASELVIAGNERDPGYELAFDALVSVVLLGIVGLRREHGAEASTGGLYANLRQIWRLIRNYHHALSAEGATRGSGLVNPLAEFQLLFAHRIEPRGLGPISVEP